MRANLHPNPLSGYSEDYPDPLEPAGSDRGDFQNPPCRVCGKSDWVACYREDAPEKAVCVECCGTAEHDDGETGHVWTYDRAERDRVCDHCGQLAGNTDFYDHRDEP